MNNQSIRFHLREASDALAELIKESDEEDFFELPYSIALQHLYYHLNMAWNTRDATDEETKECSDANFERWRQYPRDIPLMGE